MFGGGLFGGFIDVGINFRINVREAILGSERMRD